jgi:hypothetical protein
MRTAPLFVAAAVASACVSAPSPNPVAAAERLPSTEVWLDRA